MARTGNDLVLRAKPNESLTLDEMRVSLPSIFAPKKHVLRSERYVYISTSDMLDELMKRDFVPVEARMSRVREPSGEWTSPESRFGYTKHMVRLRRRDDLAGGGARRVGDTSFEVIMKNAHDGTGSYQFMAGLLKLICTNGLVVSDGSVGNVKVIHTGNRQRQIDKVVEGATIVLEQGPRVIETVKLWQSLMLSVDERTAFAESAHTLRFGDAKGEVHTPITPQQLLIPRRYADEPNDLWTVFNRVQENAVRGGITAMGRNAQNRPHRVTSREIRGIDGDIKLNKALWQLSEKLAAHKIGERVVEEV